MAPVRGHKRSRTILSGRENSDSNSMAAPESAAEGAHPRDDPVLSLPQESSEWWHVFRLRIKGPFSRLNGSVNFENVMKVKITTFDYICSLVKDDLMATSTRFSDLQGRPLSAYDVVAVALRRLSSGDSIDFVGETFGVQSSTVNTLTWRFVEVMSEKGRNHLNWPSTEEEMEETKDKFQNLSGLPNCCGAIDTPRIQMRVSASDPTHPNYQINRSDDQIMALQAVVDADMRFMDICTGWPGVYMVRSVQRNSEFHALCSENKILNGRKVELSDGTMLREYIVGDSKLQLYPWVITPYTKREKLPKGYTEFNKKLHAVSNVAKKAVFRLKNDWSVIDHGVIWRGDEDKLPRLILVCCILHNILIDMEIKGVKREDPAEAQLPHHHHHHHPDDNVPAAEVSNQIASAQRDALVWNLFGRSQAKSGLG